MFRILFIYIIVLSSLFGAQVSTNTSLLIAERTFAEYHPSRDVNNFSLKNIDIIKSDNTPLFYIYQLEPVGFIIVSAEDKSMPVLAYGFESNFKLENMPSNLNYIINLYKN